MNALAPTTTAEPAMLGFLQRAIVDPGFDTEKFSVVLAAVREEQAKQAERQFYAAMAAAQGEMEPVRKDATNPSTRSRYARFEAIDAVVRPVYTRHGFSVSYRTGAPSRPGCVRMICTVAHEAGHSIEAELEAALDGSGAQGRSNKTDVQATGSTVSYLRRYILNMVWNIALASEDDDGEGSRRPVQRQETPSGSVNVRQVPSDGPRQEPTSLRDMRPKPVPTRAEIDEILGGDSIPALDPEPVPDKAAEGVAALEARIRAAATEGDLHEIAGSPQVEKQRAWLARHRPELDTLLADALGQRYDELVAARQESAEPEQATVDV